MSAKQDIPYGYCHCGCGEKTNIAPATRTKYGNVKGQPMRFIQHHQSSVGSVEERFWAKINKNAEGGCWEWTKALHSRGYGQMITGSKTTKRHNVYAHRFAYETLVGPIPDGLVLDHLCRNPKCVNPAHLEPVTRQENIRRGAVCNPNLAPQA